MSKKPRDVLLDHDYDGIQEYDNDMPSWWLKLFYITIIFSAFYIIHYHVIGSGDLSRAEYLREIDPDYSEPLLGGEQTVLGWILDEHAYRSPFMNPEEDLTPRQEAEVRRYLDLTFETLLMEAMSKASAGNLEKLESSFPDIYANFLAGGHKPAFAPGGSSAKKKEVNIYEGMTAFTDNVNVQAGSGLFAQHCFNCHGAAGQGGIGPNLTDDYWLHGGSFPEIAWTITKGVPAKGMISWVRTLSTDEIIQVASFVMSLIGTNPENAKAPQGELVAGTD